MGSVSLRSAIGTDISDPLPDNYFPRLNGNR
eukprot:COSAG03_NODE_22718_length_287_cov_1.632979_1_plen_30_part_10